MEQATIGHGAGDGTDIIGELRAHENDDGAVADRVEVGALVFAGHEGRCSFSKKRTKKLLSLWVRDGAGVSDRGPGQTGKSFLVLFFKKEHPS
jgi:hypothetical protein